jgi:hypothetical protein
LHGSKESHINLLTAKEITVFEVGQQVRFVGRSGEQDRYHADYKQLLGIVGTVRKHNVCAVFLDNPESYSYEVQFEGFTWVGSDEDLSQPADWFTVFHAELEAA